MSEIATHPKHYQDESLRVYMSLSQSEFANLAISNHLKTHDATARQYLQLRQDIIQLTQTLQREIRTDGQATAESRAKLESLRFEYAKAKASYSLYLDRIIQNVDNVDKRESNISGSLDEPLEEASLKISTVEKNTKELRDVMRPAVQKMTTAVTCFNNSVTIQQGKTAGSEAQQTFDFSEAKRFTLKEIEDEFAEVKNKFANLRTVDEITDDAANDMETDTPKPRGGPAINITRYIEEHVETSPAFEKHKDGSYLYQIFKSASLDVGGAGMAIADYRTAIDSTTREIQGLVVRGTQAKERWFSNAQKIEVIQAMLQD